MGGKNLRSPLWKSTLAPYGGNDEVDVNWQGKRTNKNEERKQNEGSQTAVKYISTTLSSQHYN